MSPREGTGPAAQLLVERSGRLSWYRRDAGELRSFTPPGPEAERWNGSWAATIVSAAPGQWLQARRDGSPLVAAAPAPVAAPVPEAELWTAALCHPRTAAWYLGTSTSLQERRADGAHREHPIGVAAMAWSSDLRRLYVVSPEGGLFMVTLAAETSSDEAAVEWLSDALAAYPGISSIALGPAGLAVVSREDLVGVNLRHLTATRLGSHRCEDFALEAPAVAVDHLRNFYLADAGAVMCRRGDGTEPRWVSPPPTDRPEG